MMRLSVTSSLYAKRNPYRLPYSLLWSQWRGKENMLMSHWWYSPLFGLLGGFTTAVTIVSVLIMILT